MAYTILESNMNTKLNGECYQQISQRLTPIFLASLVALTLLTDLGSFREDFLPLHDTMQVFQVFHYLYSGVYILGQIPQWIAENAYGMPSDFWVLLGISPAGWLSMGLGKLLGITNALFVFKISIVVERWMFVTGVYLLASQLFERRYTIFFVCAGAAASSYWSTQIWWDLRIYYLLPLSLFFLIRFVDSGRGEFFWLTGIVSILSFFGNLPYFVPIHLLSLSAIFVITAWKTKLDWRAPFRKKQKNLVCLFSFIFFTMAYLLFAHHTMGKLYISVNGRDPETGLAYVNTFLTYGGRPELSTLAKLFLTGWPLRGDWSGNQDQTLYIGFLPFLLGVYTAFRVRTKKALAFLLLFLTLVWLSFAGIFARLLYWFPTMAYFRHLGLLYSLIKVVLLFCAGFGLDAFLKQGRARDFFVATLLLIFATDALVGYSYLGVLLSGASLQSFLWISFLGWRVLSYSAVFLVVVIWRTRPQHHGKPLPWPRIQTALLTLYLLDILSFNFQLYFYRPQVPEHLRPALSSFEVTGFPFQEKRLLYPVTDRALLAAPLMAWATAQNQRIQTITTPHSPPLVNHAIGSFLRFDPCSRIYFDPVMLNTVHSEIGSVMDHSERRAAENCQSSKFKIIGDAQGKVRVTEFAPGHLVAELNRGGASTNSLIYYDAFDKDWTVKVDGKNLPVLSWRGFKSVILPPGASRVEFDFRKGWASFPVYLVALLGTLFSLIVCGSLFWQAMEFYFLSTRRAPKKSASSGIGIGL